MPADVQNASATGAPKTCFVIMGFGKKTDYGKETRTLDLDATYRAIIKPAVVACGMTCIRADEITHSGVIDKPMYEMLLRADLVIADISTANATAIYELAVRPALRPHPTIVIKELDGAFHFDLNHLATLQYKHLGDDIGFSEAQTKQSELEELIRGVLAKPDTDSPVFTFLDGLNGPTMTAKQLQKEIKSAEKVSDNLAQLLEAGRTAAAASQHALAKQNFAKACALMAQQKGPEQPPDPFMIQQLALATYKAKLPNPLQALLDAWQTLAPLSADTSTDPETLGIAGAIQKRIWEQTRDMSALDKAVELYGRGFEIKRDYYNGENLALCLDLRAREQKNPDEAAYDRLTAQKARVRIVEGLRVSLAAPSASDRSDYKWMLATMANTLYAMGRSDDAKDFERTFRTLSKPPAQWELDTFEGGKKYALELAMPVPR